MALTGTVNHFIANNLVTNLSGQRVRRGGYISIYSLPKSGQVNLWNKNDVLMVSEKAQQ